MTDLNTVKTTFNGRTTLRAREVAMLFDRASLQSLRDAIAAREPGLLILGFKKRGADIFAPTASIFPIANAITASNPLPSPARITARATSVLKESKRRGRSRIVPDVMIIRFQRSIQFWDQVVSELEERLLAGVVGHPAPSALCSICGQPRHTGRCRRL